LKIAVIGSNGQLGSDLVNSFEGLDSIGLTHDEIEITQEESVSACLDEIKPEVVINTAAYHDLKLCEAHPVMAYEVNALGPRNLAIWCKDNSATMVQISTSYVFDGKNGPYTEEDMPIPLNNYAVTKLAGEFFVRSALEKHILIRTGGIYGMHPCRGKPRKNFVDMFLDLISQKDSIEFGGSDVCNLSFTEDIAKQIKAILSNEEYGLFNVVNDGWSSWFDFGEKIVELTNSDTRMTKREIVAKPLIPVPQNSALENKRLKDLGIYNMRNWEDALKDYLSRKGLPNSR
jgi:dTDP-4-dehydrorhamnose reductase